MLTVISTSTCPWCVRVKGLLEMHDIRFEEWQPPLDDLRTFLEQHGVKTVPQVFVGDPRVSECQRIGGFEDTLKWINSGRPV